MGEERSRQGGIFDDYLHVESFETKKGFKRTGPKIGIIVQLRIMNDTKNGRYDPTCLDELVNDCAEEIWMDVWFYYKTLIDFVNNHKIKVNEAFLLAKSYRITLPGVDPLEQLKDACLKTKNHLYFTPHFLKLPDYNEKREYLLGRHDKIAQVLYKIDPEFRTKHVASRMTDNEIDSEPSDVS